MNCFDSLSVISVEYCCKVKGHCTLSPKFPHAFFHFTYSSSFPIKMHATDAKTQKIEPDPIFFMMDKRFGGSV